MNGLKLFFCLWLAAAANACSPSECDVLLLQLDVEKITIAATHATANLSYSRAQRQVAKRTRRGKIGHVLLTHIRDRMATKWISASGNQSASTDSGEHSSSIDRESAEEEEEEEVLESFTAVFMNVLDIGWLFPFLSDKKYWKQNCVRFMVIQVLFVFMSILLAALEIDFSSGSSSKTMLEVLTYAAPSLLTVMALYLYLSGTTHNSGKAGESPEDDEFRPETFTGLALISNLDVFAVYVPILTDNVATPMELLGGITLLSAGITMICLLFSESQWLADTCHKIPVWAIIGVIAAASWAETLIA